MHAVPAGQLPDGTPLTGLEAAVLISVDGWAKENTDWFKYRSILKGGLIFSVIVILVGFATTIMITIIGIIIAIFLFCLYKLAKPTSLKFPMFAASLHNLVDWKGNHHFVTKNSNYFSSFTVREGLTPRNRHNPVNYPSTSEWESGDDEFYNLSLNSLRSFVSGEFENFDIITNGKTYIQPVQILLQPNSSSIVEKIISGFSDDHFGEDMLHSASEVDQIQAGEVRGLFDWIDSSIRHNVDSIARSLAEIDEEIIQYVDWTIHVRNRCEQLSSISFDSTQIGWDNSIVGLIDAERSLELSVAADVIAQEEAVKREMENAEAKLREKKADFELVIAENHEKLTRKIHEIDGMISAQQVTLNNIQSIGVSPTITMQTKYGDTYGGGGSVSGGSGRVSSVTTSVKTEYYDIDNPAYSTMIGLGHIVKGDLDRYSQMKISANNELDELSGAFQRRNEQMKKQQEERLNEIEVAKERAINAIRKDSREVVSIQNIGGSEEYNPWNNLKLSNSEMWNRPFTILSHYMSQYQDLLSKYEEFKIEIENESNSIERVLQNNSAGSNQVTKILHHWVVLGESIFSEIIPMSVVMFDNTNKVQIEMGNTKQVLGIELSDLSPIKINAQNLESCIYGLMRRNAISADVFSSLTKFRSITMKGAMK